MSVDYRSRKGEELFTLMCAALFKYRRYLEANSWQLMYSVAIQLDVVEAKVGQRLSVRFV